MVSQAARILFGLNAGLAAILLVASASLAAADGDEQSQPVLEGPNSPDQQPATAPRLEALLNALAKSSDELAELEAAKHWYDDAPDADRWRRSIAAGHDAILDWLAQNSVAEKVQPAVAVVGAVVHPGSIRVPANIMYVRFSKSFLQSYFDREFEKDLPVQDTVLGAAVRGRSHTRARTQLALIENPQQAQAKLVFAGATTFDTTAFSGPVQVHSHGVTRFSSQKRVWFDGLNVLQSAPTTSVATQSSTTGISTSLPGLRGRISLRIASREVDANRGIAQQITSQRTKHKIEQAFERVARERTAQFTQKLREQYAKLPLDGRFALSDIQCSTTPSALQIEVIARGDKEQTLAEAPPPAKDHPDIEVYIHSALLQKLMVSAELRKTLQAAVLGMVEEPLVKMVKATATAPAKGALPPPPPQPDREMEFHWTEGGDLPWLSLCWHEKTPANGNGSTKHSEQGLQTSKEVGN